jgi:hypothetical protein
MKQTPEQFLIWLRGYLDGKGVAAEELLTISCKLDEVLEEYFQQQNYGITSSEHQLYSSPANRTDPHFPTHTPGE